MKKLPYLPAGKEILYVEEAHEFMQAAQKAALTLSLDPSHPIGAVIVKDGVIIGAGANGSNFHQRVGCVRKWLHVPTGKGYYLCPGCNTKNHAEASALRAVQAAGADPQGADVYLWGHWWCCCACWAKMMDAGINQVYLLKEADQKFGV